MSQGRMPASISALPRRAVARRLIRLRASLRHAQLDVALAEGADPWSAGPLMARAAQLCSLRHRQRVNAGLVSIVDLAEHRRPGSPYLVIRDRVVLGHRESLLALAERLLQPEPVDVAVAAQLTLLVSHPASPVYVGGSDPRRLGDVTADCLDRVEADA